MGEFEGGFESEEELEDESNEANKQNVTPRAGKGLAEADMNGSNSSKNSKSENRKEKKQSIGSNEKTKLDSQNILDGSRKKIKEDETAVTNYIDDTNKSHSKEEAKNYETVK